MLIAPPEREELTLPDRYDLTFEGFQPEAFAILERLREEPHIEQYRKEKEGIRRYLKEPFQRYRDDLVLNWVLPNRLDFETERNVFSRLLKNDFGAGGCHHHLWMAFYRPGRKRLTDFQLSHSLSPDGFAVGLYVGDYASDLLRQAKERVAQEPQRFRVLVNSLLEQGWYFSYYSGSGKSRARTVYRAPLEEMPEDLERAQGLWMRLLFPRDEMLAWEGLLVPRALEALREVWPVYRFLAAEEE